jgi:peroxiredoxin
LNEFDAEEIKVIGGTVDPIEKTKKFADKLRVTFPIACDLDGVAVSAITGAFYEKDQKYIQPTGFILRPDKTIEVAAYSTGPVGRFVAQDVLNLIKYYKSQRKK